MDPLKPTTESDEALVAGAKRDHGAFGRLYDRYVDQVYQFTYRRLKDHTAAEEITAQVFHRAMEQLDRFEWRGLPFGAWLVRIAANLIHDHHGQSGRQMSLSHWTEDGGDAAAAEVSLEDQYVVHQTAHILWQAVASLPVVQQQVLVLRFTRDLSIREIAAAMGRTEGAVKQLLFRAITRLRGRLQHMGFEHES